VRFHLRTHSSSTSGVSDRCRSDIVVTHHFVGVQIIESNSLLFMATSMLI
jgi:hypothetical protein